MSLEELRKNIDEVDHEILVGLAKRRNLVKQIGEYKKKLGIELKDANRWQKVVSSRKMTANELDIPESVVVSIWNILHDWALEVEARQDD